jgi:hypothetical protein
MITRQSWMLHLPGNKQDRGQQQSADHKQYHLGDTVSVFVSET